MKMSSDKDGRNETMDKTETAEIVGNAMKARIRLEALSNKVRQGIPIDINEALEVIDYQESLKTRVKSPWYKK